MTTTANTTGVTGHQAILDRFARWLAADRLASAYLFTGPQGTGKYTTARIIARCLLCEGTPRNLLESCGTCPACQQVDAFTHPDLLEVEREKGTSELALKLLIGEKEHRNRAGLCYDLSKRPFRGGRRVAIIQDADFFNQESANCLLKTLEEPPDYAVIFLIATSEFGQLPTIRSRCQIVRFQPLTAEEVFQVLVQLDMGSSDAERMELARACGGNLQMAMELSQPESMEFRKALYQRLASLDATDDGFAETMSQFVDAAGKEAPPRRDRLRVITEMASRFFHQIMLMSGEPIEPCDKDLAEAAERAFANWRGGGTAAARCIERCIEVRGDISANANQAVLIECWLSDLGRLMRGESLI